MERFYSGFVGILGTFVRCAATLVATTSMLVELSVDMLDLIEFECKAGNCGKVGVRGKGMSE